MYREDTESRKIRAIGMILETTVSYQEVSKLCMLSLPRVAELKRELVKLGCDISHRNDKYTPEYRPSPKVNTELNMKAWRNESERQERRERKPTGMRTRSNSIELMIKKYR